MEILFLAWVDKNKGIFELIEACRLLNEEKINLRNLILSIYIKNLVNKAIKGYSG